MQTANSSGLRMEPWKTLAFITSRLEKTFEINTFCCLFRSKLINNFNKSPDILHDVSFINKCVCDFLVTLLIVHNYLAYIQGLSKSLQERSIDVGRALSQVNVVKGALAETREEVEDFNHLCFQHACSLAETVDIPVEKPRTCGRQKKRNNCSSDGPKDYFRQSVTVPFLDHLIMEMNTRFTTLHERATPGLNHVPSMMDSCLSTDGANFDFSKDGIPS